MTTPEELAGWVINQAADCLLDRELPVPTAQRVHSGRVETVPWDHCCDGGQIVAAIEPWYPSRSWPSPLSVLEKEALCWVVPITVELTRCVGQDAMQGPGGMVPFPATEALHVAMLDYQWLLGCWFDRVLRHGDHQGFIRNVSGLVSGDCYAVRVAMTLQIP